MLSMNFVTELRHRCTNYFNGGIKEKICFVHIHKCGGTSINAAIRQHFLHIDMRRDRDLIGIDAEASSNAARSLDHIVDLYRYRQNLLLYFMNIRNTKYISGHFFFSEKAFREFHGTYAFITVLRNPVKRWISHYFFNRYKKTDFGKIHEDITTCLKSDFGRHNGSELIQFVGGFSKTGDYTSKEAIDRAKRNLHKFDVVGCLEYQKDFLNQFENRFGVRLNLGKKNQSPKAESFQKAVITEEVEDKIRILCKPDLALYQYAIKNFVKTS